jgi:hypothetical protein
VGVLGARRVVAQRLQRGRRGSASDPCGLDEFANRRQAALANLVFKGRDAGTFSSRGRDTRVGRDGRSWVRITFVGR